MKENIFPSVFAFLCGSRRVKKIGLSPETTNMLMQNVERKARTFALRFLKVMDIIVSTLLVLMCILHIAALLYAFMKTGIERWITLFVILCATTCAWYTLCVLDNDIKHQRRRLENQPNLFLFLYEDESRK